MLRPSATQARPLNVKKRLLSAQLSKSLKPIPASFPLPASAVALLVRFSSSFEITEYFAGAEQPRSALQHANDDRRCSVFRSCASQSDSFAFFAL